MNTFLVVWSQHNRFSGTAQVENRPTSDVLVERLMESRLVKNIRVYEQDPQGRAVLVRRVAYAQIKEGQR